MSRRRGPPRSRSIRREQELEQEQAGAGREQERPQADAKYHDQLMAALHFLQSAIGSVVRMDELLLLPGSSPLQDLLQGPRAAQLADMATGQECIAVVTQMCLEAWAQAAEARSQAAETACEQVNGLAE